MEVRHNTRVQPITLRNGQRTSVRLDPAFFCALRLIACQRGISMAELIRVIEAQPRPRWRSLASTHAFWTAASEGVDTATNASGAELTRSAANKRIFWMSPIAQR